MRDDHAEAKIIGSYDFDKGEVVPLDKCVERGLMTQEEHDRIVEGYRADGWIWRDGTWDKD